MGCGCLLLPVITLILVLKFASDRRPQPIRARPSGSTLSIPPPGKARLLPGRTLESDRRDEYQWNLIGDRNWTKAEAVSTGFSLSDSYAFNDRAARGGTHVWIVSLIVTRDAANSDRVRVDSSIHGSNGTTVTRTWQATRSESAVTVERARDALIDVPAEVRLASAGSRPLILTITR
jgi:hypothetical protein